MYPNLDEALKANTIGDMVGKAYRHHDGTLWSIRRYENGGFYWVWRDGETWDPEAGWRPHREYPEWAARKALTQECAEQHKYLSALEELQ